MENLMQINDGISPKEHGGAYGNAGFSWGRPVSAR